jgi:hypothetical protein
MNTLKIAAIAVGGIIILVVLAFTFEVGGLAWKSFFAPKHEAVRREVFKETRSYNEGNEQELIKLRLEYLRADSDDKEALASTIRLSFADYPEDQLDSPDLRTFLREIKLGEK